MFTAIKSFLFGEKEDTSMKAFIISNTDGTFALRSGGETIGTYSRRRDAVRGANRRELHLIG